VTQYAEIAKVTFRSKYYRLQDVRVNVIPFTAARQMSSLCIKLHDIHKSSTASYSRILRKSDNKCRKYG